MQELKDDHRGHVIITHASGPYLTEGPFIASYSVWKIEPNNSYRALVQGSLPTEFQTTESARSAATLEAKEKLDAVLDAE